MCGILGSYVIEGDDFTHEEFDIFIDSLKHRGPNSRGVYKDKDVFLRLGHRKLFTSKKQNSLSNSIYSNKRFAITFDGQIYNDIEIKNELEAYGHKFETNLTSEIVIAAFLKWGFDCQFKFNGMWAFTIWDSKEKELFISRDRFGLKPLFYYLDNKKFIFASETKAFWHLNKLNISFNYENIATALNYRGNLDLTEKTILNNVYRLMPGHFILFSKKKNLKIKRWWNTLDHLIDVSSKSENHFEKFNNILKDASKIRIKDDFPIASGFSGGIDSGSIVKTITEIREENERLKKNNYAIITLDFPSSKEEYFAKKTIEFLNLKNTHFLKMTADKLLNDNDKILYALEDLFNPFLSAWFIFKKMKELNFFISIDGHGSDELLSGYPHYVMLILKDDLSHKRYIWAFKMYRTIRKTFKNTKIPEKYKFSNILKNQPFPDITEPKKDWFFQESKKYELNSELLNDARFKKLDILNQLLYREFHFELNPFVFKVLNLCSMAHNVEMRAPFMDHRLVTYLFSLNRKYKVNHAQTKYILRKIMKNKLPDIVRTRMKIEYYSNLINFMKKDLKPFILDQLSSRSFLQSPIFDGKKINLFAQECYRKNDFESLRPCWEFINANRLMEIYLKKHSE